MRGRGTLYSYAAFAFPIIGQDTDQYNRSRGAIAETRGETRECNGYRSVFAKATKRSEASSGRARASGCTAKALRGRKSEVDLVEQREKNTTVRQREEDRRCKGNKL